MGWIKEHGIESFDTLAERMRGSSRWPVGTDLTVRGLGNQLRKLDRGEDLIHWWRKGAVLRPALADAMGMTIADLESALGPGGATEEPLAFPEFPALRPFDPESDAPPPGLPPELVDPTARWHRDGARRLWWVSSGTERALARTWAHRKLDFVVVSGRRWEDVIEKLPAQGRVWVDLSEAGGQSPEDTPLSEALRLVVAAPFALAGRGDGIDLLWHRAMRFHRPGAEEVPNGHVPAFEARSDRSRQVDREAGYGSFDATRWKVVAPPPAALWLPELLDWVDERRGSAPGFRASAEALLAMPWVRPHLASPGDVLEILGLLHEGAKPDASALLEGWLRARLDRADSEQAVSRWLLGHGPRILIAGTRGRLQRGWRPELAPEQWEVLLDDPENIPDPKQALALLEANHVEAAKRMLRRPSQGVLLAALRTGGVLVPRGVAKLGIVARWAEHLLVEAAMVQALSDPGQWGALLLGDEVSPFVVRALYARAVAGDLAFAEEAVRCLDASRVETVAAIEGACLVVGLAAARRQIEPVLASRLLESVQTVQSDWCGQALSLVHWDRRVRELSVHAARVAEALLGLAAGKRIGPGRAASVVNQIDWLEADQPAGALDIVAAVWVLGARIEANWTTDDLPAVCGPARLVRLLAQQADTPELRLLLTLPFPLRALRIAAEQAGADMATLLAGAWSIWVKDDTAPPFAWLVGPPWEATNAAGGRSNAQRPARIDEALELWSLLPVNLVDGPFLARLPSILPVISPALSPAVWERIWSDWCASPRWLPPELWRSLPERLVRDGLSIVPLAAAPSHAARTAVVDALWEVWPDLVAERIESSLSEPWVPWVSQQYWFVNEIPWRILEPRIDRWLTLASPPARLTLGERIQRALQERLVDPRVAWPMLRRAFGIGAR